MASRLEVLTRKSSASRWLETTGWSQKNHILCKEERSNSVIPKLDMQSPESVPWDLIHEIQEQNRWQPLAEPNTHWKCFWIPALNRTQLLLYSDYIRAEWLIPTALVRPLQGSWRIWSQAISKSQTGWAIFHYPSSDPARAKSCSTAPRPVQCLNCSSSIWEYQ